MIKNIKKRSVSESEVIEKKGELAGNVNKPFKKNKVVNKLMQNGQEDKHIKKDVPKNVKVGGKKDVGVAQSLDKSSKNSAKQKVDKENQGKKKNKGMTDNLTPDEIKARIESITSRDAISRTAKRKLAFLKKLLKVKGGSSEQDTQQQPQKVKNQKSVQTVQNKQVQNKAQNKMKQGKVEAKSKNQNKKKDAKQGNQFVVKAEKEEEEEDGEEIDEGESEDEDESEVEEQEEEEEEDEDEEEDEEEEEEEESEEEEEDKEEESEEDEEDENENDKVKTNNVQAPKEKIQNNNEAEAKKKRYVAFVGNLPYTITSDEIKKHFLTKVSNVVNIRIPTKDGSTSRGFAYVEFANSADFEKAFLLHHSMLNGRRINVQYSGVNRKEGVAKNFKLQALQKAGKFAAGRNRPYQRNFGNKERKYNKMNN